MSNINMSLESVIDGIRNILRSEGITDMDSINHCLLFMVLRHMNKKKCEEMKIPLEFSFNEVSKIKDKNSMYNKVSEFYKYFVNILGFGTMKFTQKNVSNTKEIINLLSKLNIDKLSDEYDLVGSIFELHLKTGSSNARDLGQFFTHRLVIDYMIKLCNPQCIEGLIESICDPTMGTGGFLTMAVKHLNRENKIDWSENKDKIYGFDIDNRLRNMAFLNLLLETGKKFENLKSRDVLYNDIQFENSPPIKVDIILANEPMGLKNIIHANCCDRIKELKMRGTKAEPLFLQLFCQSLNKGGRCAVIIPDGMLFNKSNLHKDTRKYIVENFEIKEIISLNGKFFTNTNVSTSILFFTNTGRTSNIKYSEIKLTENGLIKNDIIEVNYDIIKKNEYSLELKKYQNPGVLINNKRDKKLVDICEVLQKGKHKSKEHVKDGIYPLFYCSIIDIKRLNKYDFDEESIIMNTTNGSGKCQIHYINGKHAVAENTLRFRSSNNKKILTKYIYYYLKFIKPLIESCFRGTNQKQLDKNDFFELKIPVIPIIEQEELVSKFDIGNSKYQNLTEQANEQKIFNEKSLNEEFTHLSGVDILNIKDDLELKEEKKEEKKEKKEKIVKSNKKCEHVFTKKTKTKNKGDLCEAKVSDKSKTEKYCGRHYLKNE
jgi:type I restriction-modification system DNA methylase subunit